MVDINEVTESVKAIQAQADLASLNSSIVSMGAAEFRRVVTALTPEEEAKIDAIVGRALAQATLWQKVLINAESTADELLGLGDIES